MSFKISSIGIRACMDDIWVFSFLVWKPFFWAFFFFILCWFSLFKPDWCWRLVENIVWSKTLFLFYFMVFGAHLMGFRKLGLILILPFMRFLCNFLGLDWRIDVWGWKPRCFHRKMHKILAESFFSPEKPGRVQPGGEDEQCIMTSYLKIKTKSCSARWRRWTSWRHI